MCLFRSKKEEKVFKLRTLKLQVKCKESHNIEQTAVELTFADGTMFHSFIYGYINTQYHNGFDEGRNYDMCEPCVWPLSIIKASKIAAEMINSDYGRNFGTYTKDSKNSLESHYGQVIHMKILKTVDFFEEIEVFEVVPI